MSRLPALADLAGISGLRLPEEPPCPEVPAGQRVVYLADAATGLEDRLLRGWAGRCPPPATGPVLNLAPSRIRRPGRRTDPRVGHLAGDADTWLVPLRVVWMPAERFGRRTVSWFDVLKLGDPRDPRWFRDYLILRFRPDRVRIVVGAGATAGDVAATLAALPEYADFRDFLTRRAWRALDRAERAARGDRYKIPRFVAEDIANRPGFRARAVALGSRRGLPEAVAVARARYYLAEIAATHSPFVIDLIANLIHWIYRQGYGSIRYDPATVAGLAQLGRDHPLVFLPSHRSNLDRLALQFMLWENDLPPNHTAGGVNMNFFPVGPLVRRTGVFFIRRSFKNNELYKYVLRTYLDYLIEHRFPLEWYMEGGRSRSGKLRPPRFGMLSWVVDSYRRAKADDVYLIPISIAYDQIQDVTSYASEASGGGKERESLSWALRFIASLRRRYGDIHIRFAPPISLASALAGSDPGDDDSIEVQKLAFEVMYRIGGVTPVTPTSLVATVLLAFKGGPRGLEAIASACRGIAAYARARKLPTTAELPTRPDTVMGVLATMEENGLVSSRGVGDGAVWWMDPDQTLRSSYYRNTVVHFFVPRGLAEIALAAPHMDGFRSDLLALRDLLKFEFFFAGRDEFLRLVADEVASEIPDWQERVQRGEGVALRLQPSTVGWAVLPLLEAYLIVADELATRPGEVDEKELLAACLERGRLYRREGRIRSDESVSQALFGGALLLAENRDLIQPRPGIVSDRLDLAAEVMRFVATGRSQATAP